MDRLKALLKGGQQGVTMGAADEMAGGIPAALDALGIGGGITDKNKALAEAGFTGDIGPTSSNELYKKSRDEDRAEVAQAEKDHPGAYKSGLVGGGLLTALSPLPSTLRAETIGSAIGRGASYGGLTGLGSSTKDDLAGQAEDALGGAIVGGAGGAAFQKLKGLITSSPVLNAKGGFGKVRGPDMEEIRDLNPRQIENRMLESGVTDKLAKLKESIMKDNTLSDLQKSTHYTRMKQQAVDLTKKDLMERLKKAMDPQGQE